VTCFLIFLLGVCAGLHAADKPNIVVIVADDLGYADVLFNPRHPKEVTTPHLDALAKESVVCRQGYVSGHVCAPTRAGLMTGRYQQRIGFYTAGPLGAGMPMSEKVFPQYFKPAGYVTAQFGKWHLGPTPEWSPALRGFDEVFGFLGRGAHDYFKLDDPKDPTYRGTTPVKETGYLTDRLGEETAAFITRQKDKPFLVYLAFNAVHAPLQAPADEIAKFNTGTVERNTLLAMGKRMDDAIGLVVDTLKKQGVWENTLLFFISDNGGPLAQTADNTPLRGGKHQDYEGGIRVPFLICWPGKLKPGETQAVVNSLDILPTALAAGGLTAPADKPLDGINLLPILRGETPAPSRDFFWSSGSEEGWWAVRSGDWKLVGEKARVCLFNLAKDVSEKNDLAAQMPDKVAELTRLHDAWLAELPEPIQAGAKRFGLTPPAGATPKKPKSGRKKSKGAPPLQTPGAAEVIGAVRESFAKLPRAADRDGRPPAPVITARDHCAWPNLKLLNDGRTLAALIFNNASHGHRPGDIECWLSPDGGATWKLGSAATQHEPDTIRMNHAAGLAKNGDLLVLTSGWSNRWPPGQPRSRGSYRYETLRPWVSRSPDGGLSWWVDKEAFPPKTPGNDFAVPFGDVQIAQNGDLCVAVYSTQGPWEKYEERKFRSWLYRSTDDGKTWGKPVVLAPDANETTVLHLRDGRWLAVARIGSGVEKKDRMTLHASSDDGRTWQFRREMTGFQRVNGHLLKLHDGRVLFTCGDRASEFGRRGLEAMISPDGGETWSAPVRLIDWNGLDGGYPSSVQRKDGQIVTAYYASALAGEPADSAKGYHMAVIVWDVEKSFPKP
jgi:arylsulfatase A-like enzyme